MVLALRDTPLHTSIADPWRVPGSQYLAVVSAVPVNVHAHHDLTAFRRLGITVVNFVYSYWSLLPSLPVFAILQHCLRVHLFGRGEQYVAN